MGRDTPTSGQRVENVEGEPRRTQQQRREDTHRKLIDASIALIRDIGIANFTTAEVAKKAGVTRGAIQYHFACPKDLLKEVVVNVVWFLSSQINTEELQPLTKEARLDRLVDLYWEGYRSETYVVFLEIAVQGRKDPDFKQSIEEALAVLEKSRDGQWLKLFYDYPHSDTEKLEWRSTLLDVLRGLAVRQMFTTSETELEQLYGKAKEMFVESILRATARVNKKNV